MDNTTLDRIEKLRRLALNNPSVEEARSAALACLRLMDKHQVEVRIPVSRQSGRPTYTPPPLYATPPHLEWERLYQAWQAKWGVRNA